jgi:hypothetical protein
MFLTYHCTLFEMPYLSGSFAITIKQNVIEIFHMMDVYLFYITKGRYVMLIQSEHLFIVRANSNYVTEPLLF